MKTKLDKYLKKEQKKIDKAIKDLKNECCIDVEMGYTKTYENWFIINIFLY
jgi:hypothetical protein